MRRVDSLEKTDAGRDWGQEEKGTTEDEMAGWHHWLNGRESEWTPEVGDGQGGLACCDSWGRKESDTTEWLIWSDLNSKWDELFLSLWTVFLGSKSSYVSIFRFHLHVTSFSVFHSMSLLPHLLWSSLPSCLRLNVASFHSSLWLMHIPFVYGTHCLYLFPCPCTLSFAPVYFLWKPVWQGWHGYPCLWKRFFSLTVCQAHNCCFLMHFRVLFSKDPP